MSLPGETMMTKKVELVCFVDDDGILWHEIFPFGNFRVRRATPQEREESLATLPTGHITVQVAARTAARLQNIREQRAD